MRARMPCTRTLQNPRGRSLSQGSGNRKPVSRACSIGVPLSASSLSSSPSPSVLPLPPFLPWTLPFSDDAASCWSAAGTGVLDRGVPGAEFRGVVVALRSQPDRPPPPVGCGCCTTRLGAAVLENGYP